MTNIERAIRHAVEAGKLRAYVQQHGEGGLGGLLRLANRHSGLATAALMKVAEGTAGEMNAAPSAHAARVGGARAG